MDIKWKGADNIGYYRDRPDVEKDRHEFLYYLNKLVTLLIKTFKSVYFTIL